MIIVVRAAVKRLIIIFRNIPSGQECEGSRKLINSTAPRIVVIIFESEMLPRGGDSESRIYNRK